MRGPGAAAVGHLDNPREYSGGRGKRGGTLTRGCGRNCPGWTDSKKGDIAEVQRTECSVVVGSCQGGMNEDWAEGSLRGALGPGTLLGSRRNEGCSGQSNLRSGSGQGRRCLGLKAWASTLRGCMCRRGGGMGIRRFQPKVTRKER